MIGEIVIGLVVVVLDAMAIVQVVDSGRTPAAKILWIVAILIFPIIGMLAWFAVGRVKRPA